MICKSVINVVDKIKKLNSASIPSYSSRSKVINEEEYNPIQTESSKLAVEVNQGIMIEVLKKFMFACKPGEHPAIAAANQEEEKKE